MSSRLEMIKRLAVTDAYWAAYLDGMNDAHHVGEGAAQSADFAEHARLLQARLARIHLSGNPDPDNPDTDPFFGRRASFMSDKISMDEARERVRVENAADLSALRIP